MTIRQFMDLAMIDDEPFIIWNIDGKEAIFNGDYDEAEDAGLIDLCISSWDIEAGEMIFNVDIE